MSGNFGFRDLNEEESPTATDSILDKLSRMPQSQRRNVSIPEIDQAAQNRGFSSREPGAHRSTEPPQIKYRKPRRKIPRPKPEQLTIRVPPVEKERFEAGANDLQLTYEKFLLKLMDEAGIKYPEPESAESSGGPVFPDDNKESD